MQVGDFYVPYPEKHTFKGDDLNDVLIPVGDYKTGHTDKFKAYMTWDSLSSQVRILYYSLIEPSTVDASDYEYLLIDVYSDNEQTFWKTNLMHILNLLQKKIVGYMLKRC